MTNIDRRDFLRITAGAGAAIATGATGLRLDTARAAAAIPAVDRPNILYILTDQLTARVLGCYGGTDMDTPNIDALAASGTVLESAFTTSGVCTPSRAALATGYYAFQTGAYKNSAEMTNIPAGTIGDVANSVGYRTAWLGKWHLSGRPKPGKGAGENSGFADTSCLWNRGHWKTFRKTKDGFTVSRKVSGRYHPSRSLTTQAIKKMQPGDDPWFCVIAYPDPHPPFGVPKAYRGRYNDATITMPEGWDVDVADVAAFVRPGTSYPGDDLAKRRKNIEIRSRSYYPMVKLIDDQLGRLVRFLEGSGQRDNTIIVFSTDHGELLGEYTRNNKGPALPGTFRLPMVWSGPGIATQRRSELFGAIDLHPTVAEIVGAKTSATMGKSQLSMLSGGAYTGDGRVFFHGQTPSMLGVISDDWFVGLTESRGTAVKNRRTGEMVFTKTDPNNDAAPAELIDDIRKNITDLNAPHGQWLS